MIKLVHLHQRVGMKTRLRANEIARSNQGNKTFEQNPLRSCDSGDRVMGQQNAIHPQ